MPKQPYLPCLKDPVYRAWRTMKRRCYGVNYKSYAYYGGAGIKVCDEWLKSFAAFKSHLGDKPSLLHSLDRIDNSRGYEPGNVRWATKLEQLRNRKHVRKITYRGRKMFIADVAKEIGISPEALRSRFKLMPIERAVEIPPRYSRKRTACMRPQGI